MLTQVVSHGFTEASILSTHSTHTAHAIMPYNTNKQPDIHQLRFKITIYYKYTVSIVYGKFSLYVTDFALFLLYVQFPALIKIRV